MEDPGASGSCRGLARPSAAQQDSTRTLTLVFCSKPSIWVSSSIRMRCTSLQQQGRGEGGKAGVREAGAKARNGEGQGRGSAA